MNIQQAFDELFKVAEKACDSDVDLSEQERNEVMNELWSVLRKTKKFYTGELPKWLQP